MVIAKDDLLAALSTVTSIPVVPFRQGKIDYEAHAKNVRYLLDHNHLSGHIRRVIGIAGTIFVNMIRIFSLSVYALKVTTDPKAWEEFHSVAGEIMFLPWLFIFLLVVTVIETKRLKKLEESEQNVQK